MPNSDSAETLVPQAQDIARPPEGAVRNLAQLLQTLEGGQLHADGSVKLEDLVRRLHDELLIGRNAKGSMTIKIELLADRGTLDVTGSIAVKMPAETRGRTVFYIANAAFLSTRDPRQPDLPFRTVRGETPEMRTVP